MDINIRGSIESEYIGYHKIIKALEPIFYKDDNIVVFDFHELGWIDANLLAIIGCIFIGQKRHISVTKNSIPNHIEKIWAKNGFGKHFGIRHTYDTYNTVVEYNVLHSDEINKFSSYVADKLLSKPDLPSMSDGLKKEIKNNLSEIFGNAGMHGKCKDVILSGQMYPAKKQMNFTIANLGTTITENVQEFFSAYLNKPTPSNTISWATGESHSTKILVNGKSGGLGLSYLKEFIEKNNGKIQICSGNEYWELDSGTEKVNSFEHHFPGTIVTVKINLNDTSRYVLASEIVDVPIIF